MDKDQFRRENHFAPCVYLKGFAGPNGQLFTYRTLVSRPEVPFWKPGTPKGVGHLSHLYTRIAAGHETDEIERWLDREFEAPAAEPLRKATSGARLTTTDWEYLVRFLAAQIVRTPAFFVQNAARWHKDVPNLLNSTLRDSVKALQAAKASSQRVSMPESAHSDYLPIKVEARAQPGQDVVQLEATVVVGRGMWLFGMKRLLTGAAKILHDHKWSILAPSEGLEWFTSDDPVVRLNYYDEGKYDFNGGWGQSGTEILFPLSPAHLLYTRIGQTPPRRGEALSRSQTLAIRRFIAEHAFRTVIAGTTDQDVPTLRPRIVDCNTFRDEHEQWRKWHSDQTRAELELLGSTRKVS